MIEKLKSTQKERRFRHTLSVAAEAERLAEKYGVDKNKARLAGLLHDCAKNLDEKSGEEFSAICTKYGVTLDELKGQTAIDRIDLGAEVGAGGADPIDHRLRLCHVTVDNECHILCKTLVEAGAESAEYIAVLRLGSYHDNNKTLTVAGVCGVDLVGGIVRILISHRLCERQKLTFAGVGKNTQFHFHAKILLDGCMSQNIITSHFIINPQKRKEVLKENF